MSPRAEIRPISASQARPLRQQILRPRQTPEELVYPGDDAPDALHVGAFLTGTLVGVATVTREPCPELPARAPWRVRGMATLESVRRSGIGAALLDACRAHAAAHGGTVLWCHARTGARDFYWSQGFRTEGDEFDLPDIGPHFLMHRDL